jgi:acyl transferase domain-containing protein
MLANRVSYFFDLRGPSITLDTACSSGLIALHEACKSIRHGEVTQALVGGANLILDPDQADVMSSMS